MPVKRPTADQIRTIGADLGLHLSSKEAESLLGMMSGAFHAYDVVSELPDHLPAVKYPRTPGYRPEGEENKYNAWYVKSTIKGADSGKLKGKTVALKDNVCLAGVPMMVGASTLEGYVPDVDATIVTRMLDAGAEIRGKAVCEYFCLSGSSNSAATGYVTNPWNQARAAGGSSSGSGVLVATDEVDMAIGGDQGGSIRIPASWVGIVGLKPTWGLVPYSGVMPIEATIDHTGPMTRTVFDNALLLEVIAGEDGLDPRQYAPRTARYTEGLNAGIKGLKIGVVKEGFGHPESEADVDASVRKSIEVFRKLGARVEEISVPIHAIGRAIWTPTALEGLAFQMMKSNGGGLNAKGLYVTSLIDAHSRWRSRADQLFVSVKVAMLAGEYMNREHGGHFYAKSQNLIRRMTGLYDAALQEWDLLLMPTIPMKATKLPPKGADDLAHWEVALNMNRNTSPFCATGHPAISIPCGLSDGLPVGLMLIGKHWDESTIYRASHAYEQAVDWKKL